MSTLDPFGPNFYLKCNVCFNSTTDTPPSCLNEFLVYPCNLGKERLELINKIIKEIGNAWKEGRQLPWLDDWMRIDAEKLKQTSLVSFHEQVLLDSEQDESQQLLTEEGYFNLSGIHGGCKSCVENWTHQHHDCQECRAPVYQKFSSEYLDKKIQINSVGVEGPSRPIAAQPLNHQMKDFLDDLKGLFSSFGRSIIGGGSKNRSEHLQIGMHRLDRVVSIAINGLIHNVLFHGAVKTTLVAFQKIGFQGLGSWIRLSDSAIEWNLSWTQHVLIWKAFVSAFDYSFRQFSVNLSYTALSHHVTRLDLLALLWVAFKVIYRTDFGWSI